MRAILLLLVTLAPLAARADPLAIGRNLNQRLTADVFATALEFMAPRTLEAVPIPEMALWALAGLTRIDPNLTPSMTDGTLILAAPGRVLFARRAPADDDARDWGAAIASVAHAAWIESASVRDAGTQGIIAALFGELCGRLDPFSRYAPPAEADSDRMRRAGAAGIGAEVARRGGGVVIAEVADDGPAAAAGLRPGDWLEEVDGEKVQGASLEAVAALLAGPEGTSVVLTLRGRDGERRSIEVERTLRPPQTVAAERRADVLVLRVTGFTSDTGARLAQALLDSISAPHRPRGLVLDLRGNRGGLLRQAVAAAETLLPHGTVATTSGRDPASVHDFVAHGIDLSAGLPVVVLVDAGSASAAEILAAALADQHRAVVVGSATFGKGLVQTVVPLPDGGELLISWSRVLAPLGWPIQGLGVLPQVCTSLGQPALLHQLDLLGRGEQPMSAALMRARAARPRLSPADILEIRTACPAGSGRELDLMAAHRLLHDPTAYAAALIGPPPRSVATRAP